MSRKHQKQQQEPETVQTNIRSTTIAYLVTISIATKMLVFWLTPALLHSFVDQWDYSVYYNTLVVPYLTNGSLPYIDYVWEYPVLMLVPVIISAIPVWILKNPSMFFTTFPILMIICDIITTICVYVITKFIYNDEKRAFIAGTIFATAISSAYFVLTKYDAFPTCIMMLAITATICFEKTRTGYIGAFLGYFTKIFPVVVLPFLAIYNAKITGIKQEIISVVKIGLVIAAILAAPIIIMNPDSIGTYLIQTATQKDVFAATLVYTIYSWIFLISGIQAPIDVIALYSSGIMVAILLSLIYIAYTRTELKQEQLLGLILCALVAIVALSKYTSPQYMVWFAPILCILVSGDLIKIGLFYVWQGIEFIKFPLIFGKIYTNHEYVTQLPKTNGQVALFFFTVEYIVLFYLVWKSSMIKEQILDVKS